MIRSFFLVFLFCVLNLGAASFSAQEKEIVVHLPTASLLQPLYCTFPEGSGSGFSEEYLRHLHGVLAFDFSHNGRTQVMLRSAEGERMAQEEGFERPFERAQWGRLRAAYVVKMKIHDKKASAKIFVVNEGVVKVLRDLPLTGDLSRDRRKMHQIADTFTNALFGVPGIASTRILYTVSRSDRQGKKLAEVWECDYDGANAHQITHEGYFCVTPSYMPPKPGYSSGSFVYVSYRKGQPKIYFASLRDGVGRRLSHLRGNQLMPSISLQLNRMVFISDVGGNPDVFLSDFNPQVGLVGKPRQIYASPRGAQGSPVFSPDGKRVAFVSNKDGAPRIYSMPATNGRAKVSDSQLQLITKENRENTSPAWSPDGTKIAYSAKNQGVRQIWVYDFATQKERQVTEGGKHKENPSWAPDSAHIVFDSGTESHSDLYIVNIHQPDPVKISHGAGEKRFPCWEPKG